MDDEYSAEEMRALRDKIEADIADLESFLSTESSSKTVELDQSRLGRLARVDAIFRQQETKKQIRRMNKELLALKSAHLRIQNMPELFGMCEACDELIPFQRLMYRPFVKLCVPCTEEQEG